MMDWVAKDRDAFLDMFVRLFYSISTDDGSKLLADEQTVQAGLAITAQAGTRRSLRAFAPGWTTSATRSPRSPPDTRRSRDG